MHPSMSEDDSAAVFAEDVAVMVKFPRTKVEEQGDRARWPWLPGTVLQRVGPDEYQVVIEVPELAVRADGSKPTSRTPRRNLYYPMCFRDASEIRLRGAR